VHGVRRRAGGFGTRCRVWASLVTAGLLVTGLSPSATGASQGTARIDVLSARPDLISQPLGPPPSSVPIGG
jgi:hypothetical protein